ncbi:hypothetical protein T10_4632 [Trichinella papuae]|uniref:Uncharacterized protein n=1 Tax=Trichinella papuae TaxID=268474 RepID=A0A0V1MWI9_9BILA|nr:hypothetical protein T10_4632 [Trichinella papuae]
MSESIRYELYVNYHGLSFCIRSHIDHFPARVAAFSVSWTAALNADILSHRSNIQSSVVFCPSFFWLPGVRRLMRCPKVLMPYDCR